jgi:preprotein translocase subunit SecG
MFGFLLAIMILDALILAAVVLMQAGQGGGLASLGGGGVQAIGGRQATTILTKATWICGGIFMGLALILSAIAPGGGAGSSSAVQQRLEQGIQQQQQATPVPVSPLQGTAPPPATPAPTGGTTP